VYELGLNVLGHGDALGEVGHWMLKAQGYLEMHNNPRTEHFFCLPHFIIDYRTYHDGVMYAW
jgi:hypothetical protein